MMTRESLNIQREKIKVSREIVDHKSIVTIEADSNFFEYNSINISICSNKNNVDLQTFAVPINSISKHEDQFAINPYSTNLSSRNEKKDKNLQWLFDNYILKDLSKSEATKKLYRNSIKRFLPDRMNTPLVNIIKDLDLKYLSSKVQYNTKMFYINGLLGVVDYIKDIINKDYLKLIMVNNLNQNYQLKSDREKVEHYSSFNHENLGSLDDYRNVIVSFYVDVIKNDPTLNNLNYIVFAMLTALRCSEFCNLYLKLKTMDFTSYKKLKSFKIPTIDIHAKRNDSFTIALTPYLFSLIERANFILIDQKYIKLKAEHDEYIKGDISEADKKEHENKMNNSLLLALKNYITNHILIKEVGKKHNITPHGFRSFFQDCIYKIYKELDIAINDSVIEKYLTHKYGNVVTRSYARSQLIEERYDVMKNYGNFLEDCVLKAKAIVNSENK